MLETFLKMKVKDILELSFLVYKELCWVLVTATIFNLCVYELIERFTKQ